MEPSADTIRPVVLIADDDRTTIAILHRMLAARYEVRIASSGAEALRGAAEDPLPDLIVLDLNFPDADGYDLLRQLRFEERTRDIPVIFVTANDTAAHEEEGFRLGAADYIAKPFRIATTLARVGVHVQLKLARDALRRRNAGLEQEVAHRMRESLYVQDMTIRSLARLAELRDAETGHHIVRTQRYIAILARRLKSHPRFAATLTDEYVDHLVRSAPLHDIGKVGIPDRILLKPGPLTEEERDCMRTHTVLGAQAIHRALQEEPRKAVTPPLFMLIAQQIARYHHERWDGAGYPEGLSGDAIPVAARLMALADTYDALLSARVYKKPVPPIEAAEIIAAERGQHFDPDVVDAFLTEEPAFRQVARDYADTPATLGTVQA